MSFSSFSRRQHQILPNFTSRNRDSDSLQPFPPRSFQTSSTAKSNGIVTKLLLQLTFVASVVFTRNPTRSINPLILTDFSSFCPHSQFFVVSFAEYLHIVSFSMSDKPKFASKDRPCRGYGGVGRRTRQRLALPGETQANGGAAFLIIYIACVFLLRCRS